MIPQSNNSLKKLLAGAKPTLRLLPRQKRIEPSMRKLKKLRMNSIYLKKTSPDSRVSWKKNDKNSRMLKKPMREMSKRSSCWVSMYLSTSNKLSHTITK
jgi:hypothetical protein